MDWALECQTDEDDSDDDAESRASSSTSNRRQDERAEAAKRRKRFNLKRLIRLLHISKPVEHVLAILGKK